MKIVFSVFFAFISFVALNQALLLSDPDYNQANPLNCSGIIPPPPSGTNFSDGAGNYAPNMNEVLVLCPDLTQGSKVSIAFATNIGFEFNIDPSDTLFIYDGPTTSAPLLGAFNSGTNPVGFYVQASFANNPSGCLTLRFVSNGTNEGTGWVANVACGDIPQPYVPHIEAFKNGVGPNILNPLDTGYVDLCFGDSVLLVATPTFPYASEVTGTGYSQTVANCTYLWTIGGSGQSTGSSVWFTPPVRSGYYVDLKITDAFPQIVNTNCKVRVSQIPIFAGTGPLEDSVCLGQNTNLIGGVTAQDTVGVTVPGGEYQVGGIFAGLTFLPDGAGQQYETSIGISGFDQTTLITSAANFDQLCLDIEHSYIGDIEITLTCPNGTTVSIMNAYNGTPFGWTALVPGGCGSGIGTFLGNDTNIDGGAPGSPVWSYCFSPTNATLGTICAENTAGNTIPNDYTAGGINLPNATTGNNIAMDTNGVYLPDGNFNDFIGCPVNGNWTITVQDNQGIDDGYIFQWGIYFNAALYPETEGYQNTLVSDFWTADPTIISGQNDTLITIQPDVTGNTFYTYNVTDNFGCAYDTTVTLYVMDLPSIFSDTLACNYVYQVTGTSSFNNYGGVWSSTDPLIFISNIQSNNPQISTNFAGIYPVSFTDEACNVTLTSNIEFPPYIYTQVLDTNICPGSSFELDPLILNTPKDSLLSEWTQQANYNPSTTWFWGDGATEIPRIISGAGTYIFHLKNACYEVTDTASIGIKPCDITAPNIIVMSSLAGNNIFYVNSEGIVSFDCVIINRWGNVIYEYTDAAGGWDGKTADGNKVEEGTYFYRIKAIIEGGEELIKHGFVVLKY
jgi:subtilisin-like proprotein convertase family protein